MKYTQSQQLSGSWVDKSELKNGQKCKITSEAKPSPSNFKDDDGNVIMQNVAKVHFEGQKEPVNCNLNKPTISGLIAAFGDDSKDWIGHTLTVETEKTRFGGRASIALYLIPQGFIRTDDENGFVVIVKAGEEKPSTPVKKSSIDMANDELSSIRENEIGNTDGPEL